MLYQLSYGGNWSGAEGNRTPDLSVANAALSQLSYGPPSVILSGRDRIGLRRPFALPHGPFGEPSWARQDSNL